MTSFLHLVADDFSAVSYPFNWASRVGGYTAQDTGFQSTGGGPAANQAATVFRKSNHTFGLNVANNPASPIVPGPSLVRTIEMILAFDGAGGSATFSFGHNSTDGLFTNQIDSGGLTYSFECQRGGSDLTSAAFANPTNLHYLTWVYDFTVAPAITWRMYDNGTLLQTHTSSVNSSGWTAHQSSSAALNLAVGGAYPVGLLELLIHDVALTDDEVAQRTENFRTFGF